MPNQKGVTVIFVVIGILIIGIIVAALVRTGQGDLGNNTEEKSQITQGGDNQETLLLNDYLEITFLWPGAHEFLSNEEAEIQILNTSGQIATINNPYLTIASSRTFEPASEGFESFASKSDHQVLNKIIIYNSRPNSLLTLKPGQFGKLHYHFLFDDSHAQSSSQTANVTLTTKVGKETILINEKLKREVIPTDHFESTAEHPVQEQIRNSPTTWPSIDFFLFLISTTYRKQK